MDNKSDWIGVWAGPEFFRPTVVRKIFIDFEFCNIAEDMQNKSDEEIMKNILELGGYYISGKHGKTNPNGVLLSRSSDGKTREVMIPWRFVHALFFGSASEVKKFGFDKG